MRKHYAHQPKRPMGVYKPSKFKNYLTLRELANFVSRDPSAIRAAEKKGLILTPARVRRGKITVRLYSPEQAEEIKKFYETYRPGRPRKNQNAKD